MIEKLRFDKCGGLVPVVIQDHENLAVLMVGFMNMEAVELTLSTGIVHYWSRKKKRIWKKGEQSGHFQYVKKVFVDNDADTLLLLVEQIGGAVEDGYRSCFYYEYVDGTLQICTEPIFDPKTVYAMHSDRIRIGIPTGSLYTMTLTLFELAGYYPEKYEVNGIECNINGRNDLCLVSSTAQEIPELIASGKIDIGITGKDMVVEKGHELTDVVDLGYNENGIGEITWVLACRPDKKHHFYIGSQSKIRVRTEIPNIVKDYLKQLGIVADVDASINDADAIVAICESGQTIESNGFLLLCPLFASTAHLYANNENIAYGWKRRKIEELAACLKAATRELPKNHKNLRFMDK
ncbi:phosphoribosyl-AMP cyclohydrolase [Microcoleus sp. B5-C4]|uniref:phosphoribosyl-AMP cyclohydrolase n=1 Tax=Microcoleus sp. B5-C4 TaxID=2818675 RepID=UPI002FD4CC1E